MARVSTLLLIAAPLSLALLTTCGDGDSSPSGAVDIASDTGVTPEDASTPETADGAPLDADGADDADVGPIPDLRAYSGGTCPTVDAGMNDLRSGPATRRFEVFLPSILEHAPLVFFWYGAGGSTQTYEWMQDFADAYDVMIVVPRAMPNMLFEWPIMATNQPAGDLAFFDDMVACIAESLSTDTRRIYTTGFSAGALWSSYLVTQRADMLASAVIYSGGTGSLVREYESPSARIPILGFHGGVDDVYGGFVDFRAQMTEFLDALSADGHFVIGCDHGRGHTIPAGGFDWGIRFLLAHQFGDTSSPFEEALPSYLPSYCQRW